MLKPLITFLTFSAIQCAGGQFNPVPVKGLPTAEVYDLLADSKGFIWAAHSVGISRYDGRGFTHFYTGQQTSSSMTDIAEDRQGRIWCHNFNGQLFYISNEKMQWFSAYDYTKERNFPRTIIQGGELLATSDRGLFVCNTATLQSRFIMGPGRTKSIAVVANTAVLAGDGWYAYRQGSGLVALAAGAGLNPQNLTLQPIITADTIYAIENDTGLIYCTKILLRGNKLVLASRTHIQGFLNTISKVGETVWVNTKTGSAAVDGSHTINGLNLSDMVVDREGNYWYSSLQKGLLFEAKLPFWKRVDYTEMKEGDYITSTCNAKGMFVCGTNSGQIFCKNSKTGTTEWKAALPPGAGAAEKMYYYGNNTMLITPSLGLYLINLGNGALSQLSTEGTVKGIAVSDSAGFVAYPGSLASFPLGAYTRLLFKPNVHINIQQAARDIMPLLRGEKYLRSKRCRDVCYDSASNTVYASFKDGLFKWQNDSFYLQLYNGQPVFAASVTNCGNTQVAQSFYNGIFFIKQGAVTSFSVGQGLKSTLVNYARASGNYFFIVEDNVLQVLDANSQTIVSTIPLPADYDGSIYSVEQVGGTVYLAASSGLYSIPFSSLLYNQATPVNYLTKATANGTKTVNSGAILESGENNLAFTFAAPGYTFPHNFSFYYRLVGSGLATWQKMKEGETELSLASVQPGNYTLEAYAVNYRLQKSTRPISFSFIIKRPWWQQIWFICSLIAASAVAVYVVAMRRIAYIRLKSNLAVEKIALENELRKSMLATIKSQMNPHFIFNTLNTIQSFVYANDKKSAGYYMGRFSELVRKILDNSNMQQVELREEIEMILIYLEMEKARLGDDLAINIDIDSGLDTEDIQVPALLVQPYVENAVKHGLFHKPGIKELAIVCRLDADMPGYFVIIVKDNGIGRQQSAIISRQTQNHAGFANTANEKRLELINQMLGQKILLSIEDCDPEIVYPGTIVTIQVPLTINFA